jgi:hypothetical protein
MFSSGAYRAFIGARLRRSLLVGVGVAAMSLALASGALAATTLDFGPPPTGVWDGSYALSGFGYMDSPYCCTNTWGQTVTVPATDTKLDSFTFYLKFPTSFVFRGEVYGWDPNTQLATAPVYESSPVQTTDSTVFQPITFHTGGIPPLTAGAQYVLFITISKNYAANAGICPSLSMPPGCGIAGLLGSPTAPPTNAYSGGDFVLINNICTPDPSVDCGGDPGKWTTTPWTTFQNWYPLATTDLAFQASFSPPLPTSKAQCKNGGWKTYGVFKNQGDCVSFVASGGKNPPSGP